MAAQYFDVEEIHRIIFEAPETSDESVTSSSGEES